MSDFITGIVSFLKLDNLTWKKVFMLSFLIFVSTVMFTLYKVVPEDGLFYNNEGIGLQKLNNDKNEKITDGTVNTVDDHN